MNLDKYAGLAGRAALFIIYFWFGLLKVFGYSPADALVRSLLARTLPFITPELFIMLFGLFEMLIGIFFLFPRLDKIAIPLFFLHMITTFGPLVLLPQNTWSGMLVPTLEGQYIIKNAALIAIVIGLMARRRKLVS